MEPIYLQMDELAIFFHFFVITESAESDLFYAISNCFEAKYITLVRLPFT